MWRQSSLFLLPLPVCKENGAFLFWPLALPKVVSQGHCQLTALLSVQGLVGNNVLLSGGVGVEEGGGRECVLQSLWATPKCKWAIISLNFFRHLDLHGVGMHVHVCAYMISTCQLGRTRD